MWLVVVPKIPTLYRSYLTASLVAGLFVKSRVTNFRYPDNHPYLPISCLTLAKTEPEHGAVTIVRHSINLISIEHRVKDRMQNNKQEEAGQRVGRRMK